MTISPQCGRYAAIPILFSSDFCRSCRFYSDGLECAVHRDAGNLWVRGGGLDLKICRCSDPFLTSNLSVVCHTKDVARLYQKYLTKRYLPVTKLKLHPCGKLQFSLTDPDGNTLYFVEGVV
ncbi:MULTISPECIES: VOC family protein [Roseibium]|uniref:VOC family protein n=1 Tax=Roseibium TaxID=150830 RepID=UPI00374FFADE